MGRAYHCQRVVETEQGIHPAVAVLKQKQNTAGGEEGEEGERVTKVDMCTEVSLLQ